MARSLFNGTFVLSFDGKGRVSIPARFRDALKAGMAEPASYSEAAGAIPLVVRPHAEMKCLEIWTEAGHQGLIAQLDGMDPLSAEYDALATMVFARSWPLETDKEGRVSIPDQLLSDIGVLKDKSKSDERGRLAFLGLGTRCQVWHPDEVPARFAEAAAIDKARRAREEARRAA